MAEYDAEIIQTKIDQHWEDHAEDGDRTHLGGSLIGRECLRELWYTFRWATNVKFSGRILRLFDRGHKEEFRFVEYLRQIGVEVREYAQELWYHPESDCYVLEDWGNNPSSGADVLDPVTEDAAHVQRAEKRGVVLQQWRIKDVFGHFGGSLDGIGFNFPEIEIAPGTFICAEDPVLLEFKTHGQKSFDQLIKDGLEKAKPEHYAQMQVYMLKRGIRFGLYMAVNKNTDELKCFFVTADNMAGASLLSKANEVITSPTPPARISNNPAWFKCRFCDHRGVCHMGEPLQRNCRTCAFSKPVDGGQWFCAKWQATIPKEHQKTGCDEHSPIEG